MKICITTFGTSKGIIPEIVGLISHKEYGFYLKHEDNNFLTDDLLCDELWVVGTSSIFKINDIISNWAKKNSINLRIKYFYLSYEDIITSEINLKFQELVYRVYLNAYNQAGKNKDNIIVSLTGGRKTMSSSIQEAAYFFGCYKIFHIISNFESGDSDKLENSIFEKNNIPDSNIINKILPVINDGYDKNPIVDSIELTKYLFDRIEEINNITINDNELLKYIEQERKKAIYSYINVSNITYREKIINNFQSLLLYKNDYINILDNYKIGNDIDNYNKEYEFIKKMPKTDLHCHLGGSLTVEEAINIAHNNYKKEYDLVIEKDNFLRRVKDILDNKNITNENKFLKMKDLVKDCGCYKDILNKINIDRDYKKNLILLSMFRNNENILENLIFGEYLDESKYRAINIEKYEQLGDYQGSNLLQEENIIKECIDRLISKAVAQNVKYLELRCSPANYTKGELSINRVYEVIRNKIADYDENTIKIRIIIILSRHSDDKKIKNHLNLIKDLIKENDKYFIGIDLAGNESANNPERFRNDLLDFMKDCIHITIHAGETMPADNIWEAIYHLSADRIGHGLTLIDRPELIKKVRNRRVGIELCPSSNYQIVNFKDRRFSNQEDSKVYPLKNYLNQGLKLSINTDNIGISRTDITKEYLKAAYMVENGLSILEVLQIIKNGFIISFLDIDSKRKLIEDVEISINNILNEYIKEFK